EYPPAYAKAYRPIQPIPPLPPKLSEMFAQTTEVLHENRAFSGVSYRQRLDRVPLPGRRLTPNAPAGRISGCEPWHLGRFLYRERFGKLRNSRPDANSVWKKRTVLTNLRSVPAPPANWDKSPTVLKVF